MESHSTLPSLIPELWSYDQPNTNKESNHKQEQDATPQFLNCEAEQSENKNSPKPQTNEEPEINEASF